MNSATSVRSIATAPSALSLKDIGAYKQIVKWQRVIYVTADGITQAHGWTDLVYALHPNVCDDPSE